MLLSEISFDNPPTELLLRLEHVWKLGNPSRTERYFALGTMWTDASGVRIQGDSPRNFAKALQDLISVRSIYKITGYTFRSPRPTFHFVGKIIGIGKPNYVARGDSTAPVQTVRVLDFSGGEVEVSLWSEMSYIIDVDAVVLDDVSNPVIVVFSCFGVGEFRGKSTASSYTASRVFLDPGHPAAISLREICFSTSSSPSNQLQSDFPLFLFFLPNLPSGFVRSRRTVVYPFGSIRSFSSFSSIRSFFSFDMPSRCSPVAFAHSLCLTAFFSYPLCTLLISWLLNHQDADARSYAGNEFLSFSLRAPTIL
ncbi:hypothetical protein LINGRAHAP2_LOCUS2669 [Linum grandiflorum]